MHSLSVELLKEFLKLLWRRKLDQSFHQARARLTASQLELLAIGFAIDVGEEQVTLVRISKGVELQHLVGFPEVVLLLFVQHAEKWPFGGLMRITIDMVQRLIIVLFSKRLSFAISGLLAFRGVDVYSISVGSGSRSVIEFALLFLASAASFVVFARHDERSRDSE